MIWYALSLLVRGRIISSHKILPISESKYIIQKRISINRLSYTGHSINCSICFLVNVIFFSLFFFFMNVLRHNPNPLTPSIITCGEYESLSLWVCIVLKTICICTIRAMGFGYYIWGAMSIKLDLVVTICDHLIK
jgi:hypothetical protein